MQVQELVSVLALFSFFLSCIYGKQVVLFNAADLSIIRDPLTGISAGNFLENKFTKLNVPSMTDVNVTSKNRCQYECLKESRCLSYNIAASPNSVGLYECQVLNTEKIMLKQFLVHSQNFDHYSIKTKCSPSPCIYYQNCVPYYNNNSYSCECNLPYYGVLCDQDCRDVPLGMESRIIPDAKITANFYVNEANLPSNARLNLVLHEGGWTAQAAGDYLQVDLTIRTIVYAYATQGRAINPRYTRTLKLMYSENMNTWLQYHPTYSYVFEANVDSITPVKTILPKGPVCARGVRFVAVTFDREPALRVEIYGCKYVP